MEKRGETSAHRAPGQSDWTEAGEDGLSHANARSGDEREWDSEDREWDSEDREWDSEDREWDTGRTSASGRLIAQIVLAAVAVGLFVLLAVILTRTAAEAGWIALLVTLLAVILVVEVLLLDAVYDRLFRRVPAGIPAPAGQDVYVVGCPGCGTVFTVTEKEIEVGTFPCHNCSRQGVIKSKDLSRTDIRRETCRTCGNTYYEYLEHSECPVCHTYNEY